MADQDQKPNQEPDEDYIDQGTADAEDFANYEGSKYNPADRAGSPGLMNRLLTKKRIAITLVGGLIGTGLIGLIAFVLPGYQLIHMKETLVNELGGDQFHVLRTRSGRIYSRAFFFRPDDLRPGAARFDGYKSRGKVFSVLENIRTNNLLSDLRTRGFDAQFETRADGRFTGRLRSISRPGFDAITNEDEFVRSSRFRRAITGELSEAYPERSALWRARRSRALFRRLGINRGNWFENTRLARAVDNAAYSAFEKTKMKLRHALFGNESTDVGRVPITGEPQEVDEDGNVIARETTELSDDITKEASDLRNNLLEEPRAPDARYVAGSLDNVSRAAAGTVQRTVIGPAAYVDDACRVRKMLAAIEIGSRTARALQLAKYAGLIFNLADTVKTGEIDADDLGHIMLVLNTPDSNGRTWFSSGGWQWASGNRTARPSENSLNKFSVGGGLTGDLGNINRQVNSVPGVGSSCGVVGNPLIQAGSAVGSITLGVLSGGATTISSFIGSAAFEGVRTAMEFVITPIATRIISGTTVTFDEVGVEVGDALASGSGFLMGASGRDAGLKPMTNEESARLHKAAETAQRVRLAEQSIFHRYFNPANHRSFAARMLVAIPTSTKSAATKIRTAIADNSPVFALHQPVANGLDSLLAKLNPVSAYADNPDGFATDPFGNPLVGEDLDNLDDLDPLENTIWMIDNGFIDADDNPKGAYKDYIERCAESIDVFGTSGNRDQQSICWNDSEQYRRFRAYRLDSSLIYSIAEHINRDFGTVETGNAVAGLECLFNLGDGDPTRAGYFRLPDAPGGEYKVVTKESQRYGSRELVCALHVVSKAYKAKYGTESTVVINDLNASGHRSHNRGVAVDVWAEGSIGAANHLGANYDTQATIDLGKMFIDTGIVKNIWWCEPGSGHNDLAGTENPSSMTTIRNYAQSKGVTVNLKCIQTGPKGHHDHFHVDILDQYRGSFHEPN